MIARYPDDPADDVSALFREAMRRRNQPTCAADGGTSEAHKHAPGVPSPLSMPTPAASAHGVSHPQGAHFSDRRADQRRVAALAYVVGLAFVTLAVAWCVAKALLS